MTLHDDLRRGAEEYTRQLEADAEIQRLAALRLEAQKASNATAFAEAFERCLSKTTDTDTEENQA